MKFFVTILALVAVAMAQDAEKENSVRALLRQANDQFTAKMFAEVVKDQPDKSVVLSPFSVLTPLSLLYFASTGESHDELVKVLGFTNENATKDIFVYVNNNLRNVQGIELKMANRIYIPENYQLNQQFEATAISLFGSEVKNVDFSKNDETAAAINSWVEDQTNKRIKDLVSPDVLTPNTRAVLVNALYFKGQWKDKFDKNLTEDRDFHVNKDLTVKVPTMYRKGDYKYQESNELDAKVLEINYVGDEASFVIVLPNKVDGLAALEEKLKDPSLLNNVLDSMYSREVEVYIPKFKIETTINLKDVLQKMEIKKLFSPGEAKLTNLLKTDESLYVSDAIQKAFIEVNEEGAEAAAANAFIVGVTSVLITDDPPKFVADHPFLFLLKKGNVVLFNGVYYQP